MNTQSIHHRTVLASTYEILKNGKSTRCLQRMSSCHPEQNRRIHCAQSLEDGTLQLGVNHCKLGAEIIWAVILYRLMTNVWTVLVILRFSRRWMPIADTDMCGPPTMIAKNYFQVLSPTIALYSKGFRPKIATRCSKPQWTSYCPS